MCPFEIPGTKRGSVKDSYIALILMAPHTPPLPRQSSGDSEPHSDTNSPDTEFDTESLGAVILNNDTERSVDERIDDILGRLIRDDNIKHKHMAYHHCNCSHAEQPHGGNLTDLEVSEAGGDGGGGGDCRGDCGGERAAQARGDHLRQRGEAQHPRERRHRARERRAEQRYSYSSMHIYSSTAQTNSW